MQNIKQNNESYYQLSWKYCKARLLPNYLCIVPYFLISFYIKSVACFLLKYFLNYLDLTDPDGDYNHQILILFLYVNKVVIFNVPKTCSCHSDSKVSFLEQSRVDYKLVLLLQSLDELTNHMREGVSEIGTLFICELLKFIDLLLALASDIVFEFLLDLNCNHYIIK